MIYKLLSILGCLFLSAGLNAQTASMTVDPYKPGDRNVFLVPTDARDANWRDFAYLSTIPLSATLNKSGAPSVITLGEFGYINKEVQDYLKRYKPDNVFYFEPPQKYEPAPVIAHYSFDETNGDAARDTEIWKDKQHNAKLHHINFTHSSVEGAYGRALQFSGSAQQKILFPDHSDLYLTKNFTVSFWMKSNDLNQKGPYLLNRFTEDKKQIGFLYRNGHIETQGGKGKIPVKDEKWHHYSFVNSGDSWIGYLDGEKFFLEKGFEWPSTKGQWIISHFGGLKVAIDDVRFYANPLSVEDINKVKNGEVLLTGKKLTGPKGSKYVHSKSLDQVTQSIAHLFKKKFNRVVICRSDDYKSALTASCLAARLNVPLLYFEKDKGLSVNTSRTIRSLGAKELIVVGEDNSFLVTLSLNKVWLKNDNEVINWMSNNGLPVNYIALTNPNDREKIWQNMGVDVDVKKISMAAPILAAGRGGAVSLVDAKNVWFKKPFNYSKRIRNSKEIGLKGFPYRHDYSKTYPHIGQVWKFDNKMPSIDRSSFSKSYSTINGNFGHARLMTHFLKSPQKGERFANVFPKVWLFASKPGLENFNRIAIDLNRDDKFSDNEVFKKGDSFQIDSGKKGISYYTITDVGGNGTGRTETSGFFVVNYMNTYVGEINTRSRKYKFAMLPSMHVPHWNRYNYESVIIDLNGNGRFDKNEMSPIKSGYEIILDGVQFELSLSSSQENTNLKEALFVTSPDKKMMKKRVREISKFIGRHPENLCVVALPTAIPYGIYETGIPYPSDILSDIHLGNVDSDPFIEIGIGRFYSENHIFTTLAASRSVTYNDLIDDSWSKNILSLGWAPRGFNVLKQFENLGMKSRMVNTGEYLEKPGLRHKNLENVSLIYHAQHSCAVGLGAGPTISMNELIPPAVLTSGGCMVLAVDWTPPPNTVCARWLRKGGVGFLGGTRQNGAHHVGFDFPFWNKVAEGQSLGQAYRFGINSVRSKNLADEKGGAKKYNPIYENFSLFGDPGLVVHVPQAPKSKPAYITSQGNTVVVHPPESFWEITSHVEQSKKERNVVYKSGPGLVPKWPVIQGHFYKAEHRVRGKVTGLLDSNGKNVPFSIDYNHDGTSIIYWEVDFAKNAQEDSRKPLKYKIITE